MNRHQGPAWWKWTACVGTDLAPQLLLAAKLMTVCLFLVGVPVKIPEPFLPFFAVFDAVPGRLWQVALQAGFIVVSLSLLMNWRVRSCCLVLGLLLLLSMLANKVFYTNGKVFCVCVYWMVGLQYGQGRAWLLNWQLAIVYFGAGVNKVLEPDWRSGQYFEFWLLQHIHSKLYISLAGMFPTGFLSWVMAWTVIVFEFLISLPMAMGGPAGLILWSGVLFHAGAMVLSGSMFGVFVPAMLAAYLGFVKWPTRVDVTYSDASELLRRLRGFLEAIDVDNLCHWRAAPEPSQEGAWLSIHVTGKTLTNVRALQRLLLSHPTLLFVFAFFFCCPKMDTLYRDAVSAAAIVGLSPIPVWLEWAWRRLSRRGAD